jgi:CheY-like chemotaxis protein
MAAKRILAIENNDLVLSFLEAGLMTAGYDVDTAHNGQEALEKLDHVTYDVIISDVRMPELDGPGLCQALAARHSDALTRFIFLTTPDVMEAHRSFLAGTGMPALTKPIALEDLRLTIDRMVAGKI